MPTPIAYQLTDVAGAPLTTATPTWLAYVDRTAGARSPPATPHHVGNGWYVFMPSVSDEALGVCYCIDNGAAAYPRRSFGSVPDSAQLAVMLFEDPAGPVWTGAAATSVSMADFNGNARSPPALVPLAGSYLYALSPSGADVLQGVSYRVDGPAGSTPSFYQGNFGLTNLPVFPSTGMEGEALVVRALREYLLAGLPAKVNQLNGLRNATLKSARVEPFVITPGMTLTVTTLGRVDATAVPVALPSGAAVTSAQVAAAINAAAIPGLTVTTDGGRVVLQSTASPAQDVPSIVAVLPDVTGGPGVFGWDAGGEHVITSGLAAPSWRGIVDGWPITVPDMGRSFWVILGDRSSTPISPDIRRDEVLVTLDVTVIKPEANMSPHRSREAISSCVRAVRELLTTTDGRYLGRAGVGDVLFGQMSKVNIPGKPFAFSPAQNSAFSGVLFDVASFTLTVKVFQRPAS